MSMTLQQEMQAYLLEHGLEPQRVSCWESSGLFIADFYNGRMTGPVKSAQEYAAMIERVLPSAQIVDTHDTKAYHREGEPIIWAAVTFRIREE